MIIILLIGTRFIYFSSEIDGPHVWRQSDTAQYIESFTNEGINLLKPSVNWMGGHKTLLLEFPLPEAMIAVLFKLFGNYLWIARLFFLSFFSLSAVYLHKILKLIFKDSVPEFATIIYCSLPLSLFYSRAIHIDFFAIAFAHAMLYYYLKALLEERKKYWLLGTLMAVIAFLIKAPYAFYLALPLFYIAVVNKKIGYLLKNTWWAFFPVVAVLLWNNYSKTTNALAPDLDFIPNYNKFTDMWYWYFGAWQQRILPELWLKIAERLLSEVVGYVGLILLLIGLIISKKNQPFYFALFWLFGTIIYLLIFYNLNVIHNYYQIPFLVPVALFIAIGINKLSKTKWFYNKYVLFLTGILIFGVLFESFLYADQHYYEIKYDQIEIGRIIREHSKPDDLVIMSYGGLSPQFPNILYQAKRYGWSIPIRDANARLYYRLHDEEGADKLAIIRPDDLSGEIFHFYQAAENKQVIELKEYNLKVFLADLEFEKP